LSGANSACEASRCLTLVRGVSALFRPSARWSFTSVPLMAAVSLARPERAHAAPDKAVGASAGRGLACGADE
jgi:hypothetical protein